MVHMTAHEKWLNVISGGASRRQVAVRAGLSQSTFNRQANAGRFDAETVIAVAKGYDGSPVAALVETGYLAPEDAGLDADDMIKLLTNQQLVRELARRVDDNADAWAGTFDVVVEDARAEESDRPQPGRPLVFGSGSDAPLERGQEGEQFG